jgi:predicted Zn finger-like uncharacterized protein
MILTCPVCGTRYQTDTTRMAAPGRNVRCAKCLNVWFHPVTERGDGRVPAEQTSLFEFRQAEQVRDEAIEKPERGVDFPVFAGWMALAIFLGGFVWAAIVYRQEIATVWPQSSSLYALLGIPVNTRGLAFAELGYDNVVEDGSTVLEISGRVLNVTNREMFVPAVRVSLKDFEERELYGWTINADETMLPPGQSASFAARLSNPPPEARRAEVRFAAMAIAQ